MQARARRLWSEARGEKVRWGADEVQRYGREDGCGGGGGEGGGGGCGGGVGDEAKGAGEGNREETENSSDYAAHTHAARALLVLMADRVGRVEGPGDLRCSERAWKLPRQRPACLACLSRF